MRIPKYRTFVSKRKLTECVDAEMTFRFAIYSGIQHLIAILPPTVNEQKMGARLEAKLITKRGGDLAKRKGL